MEQHGQLALGPIFDSFDDAIALERRHDAGGVFERQPVGADIDKLLGVLHPLFQSMNRAHGIVHLDMRLAAELLHGLGCRLDISKIIGRLEDAKDIHAVGNRALDELVDDLVGVGPVGKDMLPAQQHL